MQTEPQSWLLRFLAIGVGFALLALVELGLRLLDVAGPGEPVEDLFAARGPAFVERPDGRLGPSEARRGFLLDVPFSRAKPPGTRRIALLGGSTAMGFPLERAYDPSTLLESAFSAIDPETRYEVLNAGGFAYASHRILGLARELLAHDLDLAIVMTGHNEFLEKRYSAPGDHVFEGLRLYRALAGVLLRESPYGAVRWAAHRVDDAERAQVAAGFEANLRAIARACREAGVPLLLVSLPANMAFGPNGASAIPRAELAELHAALRRGEVEDARLQLEAWHARVGDDPWWVFTRGLIAPPHREAGSAGPCAPGDDLCRARDLDPIPVRITSPLERVLASVSEEEAVALAVPGRDPAFAERISGDIFYDHCHLQPAGQRALAASVLRALPTDWLEASEDPERLAAAAWARLEAGLPPRKRALPAARIAYETGLNMNRPQRGLGWARHALSLDAGLGKARWVQQELSKRARDLPPLMGE